MRYVRAQDVFPEELLQLIQSYVDGEYVYIPRKENEKRAWGEKSRTREEIARRNQAIYASHQEGIPVGQLAATHYLSEKSIRRILLEQKRK